jgi:hypothetical protein
VVVISPPVTVASPPSNGFPYSIIYIRPSAA